MIIQYTKILWWSFVPCAFLAIGTLLFFGREEARASIAGSRCSFTSALYVGVRSENVRCLQTYLNTNGFRVAFSGPGSSGNETDYFGARTKMAVVASVPPVSRG